MEKAFEVKTVQGVKLLFCPTGNAFDVHMLSEGGHYYGAFRSMESAIGYFKKDGLLTVLGKRRITLMDAQ